MYTCLKIYTSNQSKAEKKITCVSTNPQFSKIFLQQQFSQGKCILKIHLPTSTDQTYFP